MKNSRFRNFEGILYPDSMINDIWNFLDELHIPILVSPLHDMDINATGETKKAHYHILLCFDGVKTEDQVKNIFDSFNGVYGRPVNSIRSMARYLCHLDNPSKAQYSPALVRSFGGADFYSYVSLPSDKYSAIREMVQWCRDNNIDSFSELFEYSMLYNESWFISLCDNSCYIMKEYLKSHSWQYKK